MTDTPQPTTAGSAWAPGPGIVVLPDGRSVRCRGLRHPTPAQEPDVGYYLLDEAPAFDWPTNWIDWPDFRLPRDPERALEQLRDAHRRCVDERVELACHGGIGRTGTALAALAVFSGVDPRDAVKWVRTHYEPRAAETPWQRRWVRRLSR